MRPGRTNDDKEAAKVLAEQRQQEIDQNEEAREQELTMAEPGLSEQPSGGQPEVEQ